MPSMGPGTAEPGCPPWSCAPARAPSEWWYGKSWGKLRPARRGVGEDRKLLCRRFPDVGIRRQVFKPLHAPGVAGLDRDGPPERANRLTAPLPLIPSQHAVRIRDTPTERKRPTGYGALASSVASAGLPARRELTDQLLEAVPRPCIARRRQFDQRINRATRVLCKHGARRSSSRQGNSQGETEGATHRRDSCQSRWRLEHNCLVLSLPSRTDIGGGSVAFSSRAHPRQVSTGANPG